MGASKSTIRHVIPEVEILYEDGHDSELLMKNCEKNPGHEDFTPIRDFSIDHLPPDYRTQQHLDCVRYQADLTVKVSLPFTSPSRPSNCPLLSLPGYSKGKSRRVRCGSGTIWLVFTGLLNADKPCVCRPCRESEHPHYGHYQAFVTTASHVVYDKDEALWTKVDCFYDDRLDQSGVKSLYGIGVVGSRDFDGCQLICVTHDNELYEKLHGMCNKWFEHYFLQSLHIPGLIISHPHGCSKHVTVGEKPQKKFLLGQDEKTGTFILPDHTFFYRLPSYLQGQSIDGMCPEIDTSPGEHEVGFSIVASHGSLDLSQCIELKKWFTFPPGTKLTQFEKEKEIGFPPETEFKCLMITTDWKHYCYTTKTCPGTSGALVYNVNGTFPWVAHSGVEDGANRSCWVYLKLKN